MIQDLRIVHRRKPNLFVSPRFPVWSTCLRSLAFAPVQEPLAEHDEIYTQQAAYNFLLEIICGLHSPIVGETEVLGQFKAFSQTWVEQDPKRASLVQKLFADAKAIRSLYLSKLGTQSYGSWVRKNLQDESGRAHFIGAGILAREVLPYVAKAGYDVTVHSRDVNKIDFYNRKAVFTAGGFSGGALIIAAPVSAAQVAKFLGGKIPTQVFDLRETAAEDVLDLPCVTHALHEIFAEIEKTKLLLAPRLKEVRREIAARSKEVFEHALLRPQGWDDLCA